MASVLTFALAKAQGPQRSLRMFHCGLVPSFSHTQLEPEAHSGTSPFPLRPTLTHRIPVTLFSEESI